MQSSSRGLSGIGSGTWGGPASGGGKGRGSETATGDLELTAFEPSSAAYKEVAKYKLSPGAGLAYPVRDGIPIMLVEEARTLTE